MANKTISIDLLIQTAKSVQSTEAQKAILLDIYEALKNVEKGSTAFDRLNESATELTKNLGGVNAKFEDIYGDLQPLSSRLGEVEDRMYEMALAGRQNTQEFKDLQAEAIKMRRTIIDVDASVDAFAQKGARLQGFIGTLSGVAGGFAVIQGSMALLGSENEDLEKGLLKVQSALAVLNGLQEINRLITEKNIVVQGILNVVMKANPVFLLVGVLTAVTAAWAYFTNSVDDNTKSLNKQKEANDKTLTNIDKEIERNKKLGLSIDDLRKKRQDAYNEELLILGKQLKKQEALLSQAVSDYFNDQQTFGIFASFWGTSTEDVATLEKALDEIQQKIKDTQDLLVTDKKEASDEIINTEVARLERERALAEANGKETITLERAIIEEKKKLYKADSDEYKDLINERKILDIEYNKTLEEKLEERRKLWADAISDISEFNIEQGFIIDEETIQNYSDSIDKVIELRRFQGEEAKRDIDSEYDERKRTLNEELIELKKLGKLKVNEAQKVQEQIDLLEKNRQERLKNNTEKTEKDITSIIEDESEKRRKLVAGYTKDVLSPDEYNKFLDFVSNQFGFLGDKAQPGIDESIEYFKSVNKEILESSADLIKTSIGESEAALDLLVNVYADKAKVILKINEDVESTLNEDEKTIAKNIDLLKDKIKEAGIDASQITKIRFDTDGVMTAGDVVAETMGVLYVGLEDLAKLSQSSVTKLGEGLIKNYEKVAKDEADVYSKILFNRYTQYREEIDQVDLSEKEKADIRTEYIKDTENIQEDHTDKMLLIDLAYGKISQADLVEYFKKKNATLQTEAEKEIDIKKQLIDQLFVLEKQLQDATLTLYNNMIDQKLAANDRLYQDTIDKIDLEENAFNEQFVKRTALEQAKYDAGLAFQAKRDNAERKRQLEEDKLNKKRFNAQKLNDATTVTINTSVAVAKTIAQLGGVGAITPPGLALIAAITAGGVVQNAAILGQKYIPTYAKGGLVKGAGTGTSDSIDAKLSNGEVVINAKSVKAFAPLLDAINQAGGGVAIPYTNKPIVKSVEKSTDYNFERLEGAILSLNDRPIETYVTESSITNAQMKAKKLKSRTSF